MERHFLQPDVGLVMVMGECVSGWFDRWGFGGRIALYLR